jgi:hypothetical protein
VELTSRPERHAVDFGAGEHAPEDEGERVVCEGPAGGLPGEEAGQAGPSCLLLEG